MISERLAKLLKIQPVYKPSYDNGIVCTSDIRAFYPDFTNPNNFIKLLELGTDTNLVIAFRKEKDVYSINKQEETSETITGLSLQKILIDYFIRELGGDSLSDWKKKRIIQEAQRIKWEY